MSLDHVTITNADLGISADGMHRKRMTAIEMVCFAALEKEGVGRDNAMPAQTLSILTFGDCEEQDLRNLRYLVNHLIASHNVPVMSMGGKGGGYWLPASTAEEEAVYLARRKRAMTGLVKMSRGRKASYVDTIEQLALWFDEPEGAQALEKLKLSRDQDALPASIMLVTRLLDRIARNPQENAAYIAELQKHFSPLFVPRSVIAEIKKKVDDLGKQHHAVSDLLKKIA